MAARIGSRAMGALQNRLRSSELFTQLVLQAYTQLQPTDIYGRHRPHGEFWTEGVFQQVVLDHIPLALHTSLAGHSPH